MIKILLLLIIIITTTITIIINYRPLTRLLFLCLFQLQFNINRSNSSLEYG